MDNYKQYRRSQIAELADWAPEFDMIGVSISDVDKTNGSPKVGDKIARNPNNHADRWLVAAEYFAANFESAESYSSELSTAQVQVEHWKRVSQDLSLVQDQLREQLAAAEEKRREDVRKCEELCSYYSTRQAIRAAYPEVFP